MIYIYIPLSTVKFYLISCFEICNSLNSGNSPLHLGECIFTCLRPLDLWKIHQCNSLLNFYDVYFPPLACVCLTKASRVFAK